MSDLDSIASITVSTTGAGISRQGFGTIALVVNDGVLAAPTVDTYTSSAAVATAEGTDSPVHRMAVAAFSQSPRPKRVRVIKTGVAVVQTVKCTVAAATAGIVTTLTVRRPDGTSATYTYTQAGADTTTDIAAALVALINTGEDGTPASNSSAVITLVPNTAGDVNFYDLTSNLSTYLDDSADPGIAAKLTAARAIDDDWYGVCTDVNSSATIAAVAAWAESNDKMFMACSSNAREKSSSVEFAALKTAAYTHTIPFWHSTPKQYAGVAWMAARLIDPDQGQKTWAYATLAGISADSLTSTEKTYLDGKYASFYVTVASRNITFGTSATAPGGAKVSSGEWIDIIHGNDWIKTRVQEDVVSLIIDAGKLPYTQAGLNAIGAVIRERMEQAATEKVGFFVPGSVVVFVPDLADVLPADRAARIARDFEASADYASAIHYASATLSLGY